VAAVAANFGAEQRAEGVGVGAVCERAADLAAELGDPADDRLQGADECEHDLARFGLQLPGAAVRGLRRRWIDTSTTTTLTTAAFVQRS
jgi:hypothetical protein